MSNSKMALFRNSSKNSACDLVKHKVEYSVSEIRRCSKHKKTSYKKKIVDTFFAIIKRCFRCKSYQQLQMPNEIEETMVVTVVECETHSEHNSLSKSIRKH